MKKQVRGNCAHKLPQDFPGLWIPSGIWLSRSYSARDKIILSLVHQYDRNGNGCIETNRYFSQICGVSPRTISRWIASLIKRGYLSTAIKSNNSRRLKIVSHNCANLQTGGLYEKD